MMTRKEVKKSTFVWISMAQQQGSSWLEKSGKGFQLILSQAVADCWVATGQESSLKKLKKATHGAVYASKIITWDQKTRAKSTQRFSSEEAQNASDRSAMWKCDLSSRKREENMWMCRMWVMSVTAASLAEVASQVTRREDKSEERVYHPTCLGDKLDVCKNLSFIALLRNFIIFTCVSSVEYQEFYVALIYD